MSKSMVNVRPSTGGVPISVNLKIAVFAVGVCLPKRLRCGASDGSFPSIPWVGGSLRTIPYTQRWFHASGCACVSSGYPQGEKDSASSRRRSTNMATSSLPAIHARALGGSCLGN